MEISLLLESVISMFIVILIGVYSSRRKIITGEMNKGLIDILIRIALPFMIIASFLNTYESHILSNIKKAFVYSIIAYVLMGIMSYTFLMPVRNEKKTVLHFANVFVNTGYIGFPILNSIFGSEGVIYGSIFNIFFVLLVWTYGVLLYRGEFDRQIIKAELKKVILNPSILAVIIGIIIMLSGIKMPGALMSGIRSAGSMAGPLSMIIIGVILSNIQLKKYLKDWTFYYGIVLKLLLIPLLIYSISLVVWDDSIASKSVVIMTAMPASAMTSILADTYGKEKEYAAVVVSATTLLSLVTITFLLKIIV